MLDSKGCDCIPYWRPGGGGWIEPPMNKTPSISPRLMVTCQYPSVIHTAVLETPHNIHNLHFIFSLKHQDCERDFPLPYWIAKGRLHAPWMSNQGILVFHIHSLDSSMFISPKWENTNTQIISLCRQISWFWPLQNKEHQYGRHLEVSFLYQCYPYRMPISKPG